MVRSISFIASVALCVIFILASHQFAASASVVVRVPSSSISGSPPSPAGLPHGVIMPWFCLQRCDNTTIDQIKDHVNQIIQINTAYVLGKSPVKIEAVAFERYNLGAGGTIVRNPSTELFDLNQYLLDLERVHHIYTGITHRIAMISSFPYPPQIMNWTRELIQDPTAFIDTLKRDLIADEIHGINLDLEPTADTTDADGINYATLSRTLKMSLAGIVSTQQPHGKILTVTAASWGKLWNMPLMAKALRPEEYVSPTTGYSRIMEGYVTSMNTYTTSEAGFARQVESNMEAFEYPPYAGGASVKANTTGSMLVGLGAYTGMFPTDAQVAQHFDVLKANNLCRIALWKAPVPLNMMAALEAFGSRCLSP